MYSRITLYKLIYLDTYITAMPLQGIAQQEGAANHTASSSSSEPQDLVNTVLRSGAGSHVLRSSAKGCHRGGGALQRAPLAQQQAGAGGAGLQRRALPSSAPREQVLPVARRAQHRLQPPELLRPKPKAQPEALQDCQCWHHMCGRSAAVLCCCGVCTLLVGAWCIQHDMQMGHAQQCAT